MSPPQLSGDAPRARVTQPLVPRSLVHLGDDTQISTADSLNQTMKRSNNGNKIRWCQSLLMGKYTYHKTLSGGVVGDRGSR